VQSLLTHFHRSQPPPSTWNEIFGQDGRPRPVYEQLLSLLAGEGRAQLRRIDDNLEATMREMGVAFAMGSDRSWGPRPWVCDMLPQIFSAEEWVLVRQGVTQRLRAMELFLRDIYGERAILHDGVMPVQVVLGSPYFQRAAAGLPRPDDSFLHLSGLSLVRNTQGQLAVRHHYFGSASGISYMMQNRRALTRVLPRFFEGHDLHSIADAPTDILEVLRQYSGDTDPTVVLLSPGEGSPAFSEHSFLGRRMGIPVVQGRDLLVHNDRVYLKTISGLEQVEAIYTRVADPWLDPLVFRPDSLLGVPGLVQCIRQGTVQLLNAIGSQLADDRALLPFSGAIIRYYLGEKPILPGVATYWLGDIDQREQVLDQLENFCLRPLYGERILTPPPGEPLTPSRHRRILKEISPRFSAYVAQPAHTEALTLCFPQGQSTPRLQDHMVFGLRKGFGCWEIFPGALTRVSSGESNFVASELQGGSKDTWVLSSPEHPAPKTEAIRLADGRPPVNYITSRVAESFYWIGRYLERAADLATMISTIEGLELEELNATEQKLYRPVWNQMLPPLGNREEVKKRSISSALGRYLLTLDPDESGSIFRSVLRAAANADSIQESLSVEALAVFSELRLLFARSKRKEGLGAEAMMAVSRRLGEKTRGLVPQFFGVGEATMITDGGWKFCLLGQMVERATITANALHGMATHLVRAPQIQRAEHALEIQLSAFLRLLSSRDAYRRIYQMRIEPRHALEMMWGHPAVPRAVQYCLLQCQHHLEAAQAESNPAGRRTLGAITELLHEIRTTSWSALFAEAWDQASTSSARSAGATALEQRSLYLLDQVKALHTHVTDGFLNLQFHLQEEPQPMLRGL
jgi:uncharacterized circularly permuted ATP-grasp superfamily protein/uncharacterized alpha-E superfamily protein